MTEEARATGAPTSRSSRKLVLTLRVAVALALVLVVFGIVFNVYLYPRHGLGGYDESEYREAMVKAAEMYAASENMVMKDIHRINYRSSVKGEKHYAWGVIRLADAQGHKLYLWISLRFSEAGEWYRDSIGLLVDPKDRILFVERRAPNVLKTRSEIERLCREAKRQVGEFLANL